MNKVKVYFFATLKERAGVPSIELDIPPTTRVVDLKGKIRQLFPALEASMTSVLVSINREFAFDEDLVPPGAEVAFFPPVSGG